MWLDSLLAMQGNVLKAIQRLQKSLQSELFRKNERTKKSLKKGLFEISNKKLHKVFELNKKKPNRI